MATAPTPSLTEPQVPYAGVATRAVALAIDVAVAQVIVFVGGAILALAGTVVLYAEAALPPTPEPAPARGLSHGSRVRSLG